jgi:hypothetical protein
MVEVWSIFEAKGGGNKGKVGRGQNSHIIRKVGI